MSGLVLWSIDHDVNFVLMFNLESKVYFQQDDSVSGPLNKKQ